MILQRAGRGLLSFGRERPLGLEATRHVLRGVVKQPGGAAYLRSILSSELSKQDIDVLLDDKLVDAVATRIVSGRVSFVFLRPLDARTEGFTVEGAATTPITGKENEAGDLKPSPIVPPEYPVLARTESDQVEASTSQLNAKLDGLLFGTFGRAKRPSTIAAEFKSVSEMETLRIHGARTQVDISIETQLYLGPGMQPPKPQVPSEYVSVAQSTGQTAKHLAERLGLDLEVELGSKPPAALPEPAVPNEFVNVAESTGATTKSATAALASGLLALFRKEPFVRPPLDPAVAAEASAGG